ncbi:MAG: GYD domain-containing protein [Dehalococcoidales bacterium]
MLFVTLLSPKGKGREAIAYLKELRAPQGITVHDIYFTFGRYDGVIVFEAPDIKAAMGFVMDTGFATEYTVETLTAIPAKQL